jgi:hypothetical protein
MSRAQRPPTQKEFTISEDLCESVAKDFITL